MRNVLRDYKFDTADDTEVDYELESMNNTLGTHANAIPIQNAVQAARIFYGSRFQNQAVPLKQAEAPLVQSLIDGDAEGRSFDDYLGRHMGAIHSSVDGEVIDVNDTHVTIKEPNRQKRKYSLYKDFPMNRLTGINNRLRVKVGDKVKKGQLLAASNFTDDNGTMAMGLNARIGVVPYKGFSLEDAVVISDSFAKKLKADTLTTHDMEFKRGVKNGKGHFVGLFPTKFTNNQLDKLDKNGVVKVGQVLEEGDPFILATAPKVISSQDAQLGKLSSYMKNARRDSAQVWKSTSPGVVTDVTYTPSGVKLNIKSEKATKPGDKIVLRTGQKGVVSEIIPDDQMPRTGDGTPLEMLLNPMAFPSRVNASLIYEMLLGKVARKNGKPYKLPTFNKHGEKWFDFVRKELDAAGLPDKEKVFDPKENKWLDNAITTGDAYVLKLHHLAEKKESHRGQGSYDANKQPSKGGEDSAKRLSGLENIALLSSGATNILKEMSLLRGDQNDEYWAELRRGGDPQLKNTPFAWNKFLGLLTGAGYHARLHKDGNLRLGPVTDKTLKELGAMEIKSGETVDLNTLAPIRGGLFDDALAFQNKWGYIPLRHPVPNPAFEDAILKMLDLKNADFKEILAGRMELPEHLLARLRAQQPQKVAAAIEAGKPITPFPTTGPEAISAVLSSYTADSIEQEATDLLNTKKKTARNPALRKLHVVKGLRRNNLQPSDLMINNVPVLPVNFRPFNVVGDNFLLGDANMLYKDLINVRDTNEEIKKELGEKAYGAGKLDTYEAVKATFGFRDPTEIKTRQHGVSGLLTKLTGKGSPKTSFPQKVLMSKPQDFTGRSVIVVNPELNMDQVGIPADMAWTTFSPHVQKRMVRSGIPPIVAMKEIRDKTPRARRFLDLEMEERPIIYSRAPAWHKFNTLGGYGKIVDGDAIHVNMYMTSGATAEFDGDTMNIHTPSTAEAVRDVKEKIMPSKMLLGNKTFDSPAYPLVQELILSLFTSQQRDGNKYQFATKEEALDAVKKGKVKLSDEIEILS